MSSGAEQDKHVTDGNVNQTPSRADRGDIPLRTSSVRRTRSGSRLSVANPLTNSIANVDGLIKSFRSAYDSIVLTEKPIEEDVIAGDETVAISDGAPMTDSGDVSSTAQQKHDLSSIATIETKVPIKNTEKILACFFICGLIFLIFSIFAIQIFCIVVAFRYNLIAGILVFLFCCFGGCSLRSQPVYNEESLPPINVLDASDYDLSLTSPLATPAKNIIAYGSTHTTGKK